MSSTTIDDLGRFALFRGLEIDVAGVDEVAAHWEVRGDLLQLYGILLGGAHCGGVETLASLGAALWLGDRGKVVGVSDRTDLFRAATDGTVRSTARPIHHGRSQQVWLVETFDVQDRMVARGRVRLQNLS